MALKIQNGKLDGVSFVPARKIGTAIKPTLIVLHDTAGALSPGSSVKWFQSEKCETSAHIIIEQDGTIIQMVPFNRKANHAGQSQWRGKTFCNSFSIGIEIVSPGKLDHTGKAWFGQCFAGQPCETKEHGKGLWMPYTPQQVQSVIDVCRAICAEYSDVNEIVGHWQISPGRKIDPNPLFPWPEVVDAVFNAAEEPEFAEEPLVAEAPPPPVQEQKTIYESNTARAGSTATLASVYTMQAEAKRTVAAAQTSDGFNWTKFALDLVTSEIFLAAAAATVLAAYVVIDRWRKSDIKKATS